MQYLKIKKKIIFCQNSEWGQFVTCLLKLLQSPNQSTTTCFDHVTGQPMGMEKVESKKPEEWPPSLSSSWPQFFPGWQQMLPVRWTRQWQRGPKKQHSQVQMCFQQEPKGLFNARLLEIILPTATWRLCFSFSDTWMICTHLSFVRVPAWLDGIFQSHTECCLLPARATLLWFTQRRRAGNLAW